MKKILFIAISFIASLVLFAQQPTWKQLDNFHSVLSATFHPAEQNNLKPVKDSATVLLAKAKDWQIAAVPTGFNAVVTKPILKKLVAQCTAIKKAVQLNKTDHELKILITNAHETFHEIMEQCRKEEH